MTGDDPSRLPKRERQRLEELYFRSRQSKFTVDLRTFQVQIRNRELRAKARVGFLIFALLFLEPAAWLANRKAPPMFPTFHGALALLTILLLPLKGYLAYSFLSRTMPGGETPSRRVMLLRMAVLTLPGGTLAASAYLDTPQETRHGKCSTCSLILDPKCSQRRSLRPRLKILYGPLLLYPILIVDILSPCFVAFWLMDHDAWGAEASRVSLAALIVLHLVGCALGMHSATIVLQRKRAKGWAKFMAWTTPLLFLTPIPGPLLILPWLQAETGGGMLVAKVFERPRSGGGSLWSALEASMRQRWRGERWRSRWRKPQAEPLEVQSIAGAHVSSFCRLKLTLLPLDLPFFLIVMFRLFPTWDSKPAGAWAGACLMLLPTLAIVTGLLIALWRTVARKLRLAHKTDSPYGRYLLQTAIALSVGAFGVFPLFWLTGKQRSNLLEIMIASVLCLLFSTQAWPRSEPRAGSRSPIPSKVLWFFSFLAIVILVWMMRGDESLVRRAALALMLAILLSPLWNLLLFLSLGGWLLRPFTLRHVFRRGLPLRPRLVLASMILTAVLPLGGLAVPLWIYARLRLWPQYEPYLGAVHPMT